MSYKVIEFYEKFVLTVLVIRKNHLSSLLSGCYELELELELVISNSLPKVFVSNIQCFAERISVKSFYTWAYFTQTLRTVQSNPMIQSNLCIKLYHYSRTDSFARSIKHTSWLMIIITVSLYQRLKHWIRVWIYSKTFGYF